MVRITRGGSAVQIGLCCAHQRELWTAMQSMDGGDRIQMLLPTSVAGQVVMGRTVTVLPVPGVGTPLLDDTVETILQASAPSPRVITPRPQLEIADTELRARVQLSHKTSSHFALAYDRVFFTDEQVAQVLSMLESSYSSVFALTHESFPDRFQVYAIDQRSKGLLGRVVRSHFNPRERAIYLSRTSTQPLHVDLIEQVAHAMRFVRYGKHYASTPGWSLLEDAIGVFLNARLTSHREVFPFYGIESDVIAFHLYDKKLVRPLHEVWKSLDHATTLERSVQAGAFFLYLGDTFSDDRVMEFSKIDCEVTNDTFRDFFGRTLVQLEQQWIRSLPHSLIPLTHDEQVQAVQHWMRSIENRCEGLSVAMA